VIYEPHKSFVLNNDKQTDKS